MAPKLLSCLQHFTQLPSLSVRHIDRVAAATLAAALDSLPSLTNLELQAYPEADGEELTASLHRSSQLDHLTLSATQLYFLVHRHQPRAPMRCVRSLAVVDGAWGLRNVNIVWSRDDMSSQLPALLHCNVNCRAHFDLRDIQLPPLSAFAISEAKVGLDVLPHVITRTLRVYDRARRIGVELQRVLQRAPLVQQLAIYRSDLTPSELC